MKTVIISTWKGHTLLQDNVEIQLNDGSTHLTLEVKDNLGQILELTVNIQDK